MLLSVCFYMLRVCRSLEIRIKGFQMASSMLKPRVWGVWGSRVWDDSGIFFKNRPQKSHPSCRNSKGEKKGSMEKETRVWKQLAWLRNTIYRLTNKNRPSRSMATRLLRTTSFMLLIRGTYQIFASQKRLSRLSLFSLLLDYPPN